MATYGPNRKTATSRMVLNRKKLSDVELAVADGLAETMQDIMIRALDKVPYDADDRTRKHLRDTGAWAVFRGSSKVAGTASKPQLLFTRAGAITGTVGFGSPLAHLIERGTVERTTRHPVRATGRGPAIPFLMPAFQAASGGLGPDIGNALRRRVGGKDP